MSPKAVLPYTMAVNPSHLQHCQLGVYWIGPAFTAKGNYYVPVLVHVFQSIRTRQKQFLDFKMFAYGPKHRQKHIHGPLWEHPEACLQHPSVGTSPGTVLQQKTITVLWASGSTHQSIRTVLTPCKFPADLTYRTPTTLPWKQSGPIFFSLFVVVVVVSDCLFMYGFIQLSLLNVVPDDILQVPDQLSWPAQLIMQHNQSQPALTY